MKLKIKTQMPKARLHGTPRAVVLRDRRQRRLGTRNARTRRAMGDQ